MQTITTIGLDIAKSVLMLRALAFTAVSVSEGGGLGCLRRTYIVPPRDERHVVRVVRRHFKLSRDATESNELSKRAKAAIDDKIDAGDVAALIRRQKERCGCNLFWLTKAV
jgi:hypothetical protein